MLTAKYIPKGNYGIYDNVPQRRANWKRLDETRQTPQVRNSNLVEESTRKNSISRRMSQDIDK